MNQHKPVNKIRSYFSSEGMSVSGRNITFARDKKFLNLVNSIAEDDKERGKIWRLHVFLWAFINGLKLEGDLIECGVYRGFCSSVACNYTNFHNINKKLFLFDTWDGIPVDQIDQKEQEIEKYFDIINDDNYQTNDVKNFLKVEERFKYFPNVQIIKGRVPEVFKNIRVPSKISFLHLDMNSSIAEIGALEVLFEKMVPGSICLLDDFGMAVAFNQMKAELDWFTNKGYYICESPTSQGIIVKV